MSTNDRINDIARRLSLEGPVALVTGAGSGIGLHLAHTLAVAGAKVACVVGRADRVEAVAGGIEEAGDLAFGCQMGVSSRDSIRAALNRIEDRLGRVDVLINSAGLSNPAVFPEMSNEQWTSLLDVNLSGPFFVAPEVARRLIAADRQG